MQGEDRPTIRVRHSHALYLVNKSPTLEMTSAMHAFVGAFGKGTFKMQKAPAADPPAPGAPAAAPLTNAFILKNSDDHMVYAGVVRTLGDVVAEKRVSKPDAEVCYHKLEADDVDPKQFKLVQTHKIAFVPAGEATETTVNNFCTKESTEYWNNDVTSILWHVRWNNRGLTPSRPVVILKVALVLPPGRACFLTSA